MTDHTADEVREPAVAYDDRDRETLPIRHMEKAGSAVERLSASGRIRPARGDLRDLGPPPAAPHDISISEALSEQRFER